MNINIKVEYNELSEYKRLVFTCLQIVREFYQQKRFFLTHSLLDHENRQVVIPDVDIKSIDWFWKELEILSKEKYNIDTITLKISRKLLESGFQIESISDAEIKEYKKGIEKYLENALKDVSILFPQIKSKKIFVAINPTKYGTSGSFERAQIETDKVIIEVTSRTDMDKSHLLEIIISGLVEEIKYEKTKMLANWQSEWEINESTVDFLLKHTLLSKHTSEYVGTMEIMEHPETYYLDIIENSKNIFAKLGYPIKSSIVLDNEVIKINGEVPKKPFSESEKRIVQHLVEKKGELISNEQLQDILWNKNYDKYSLWALAKIMQRVRSKVKANGISSEIIQTIRGRGYLIYD